MNNIILINRKMGSSESKVQLIHKINDLSKKTIDASEHAFWNELFESTTTCEVYYINLFCVGTIFFNSTL